LKHLEYPGIEGTAGEEEFEKRKKDIFDVIANNQKKIGEGTLNGRALRELLAIHEDVDTDNQANINDPSYKPRDWKKEVLRYLSNKGLANELVRNNYELLVKAGKNEFEENLQALIGE